MRKFSPALKNMVGGIVIARIPSLDPEEMVLVKLYGIEQNGVWIESQPFTDEMMAKCNLSVSTTTLLIFVPYHKIEYIVGSIPLVSLSERALGLSEASEGE